MAKSGPGPIKSIIQQLRWLSCRLKEKPAAALEDFQLEHILLYHSLVGTSPEDQRQFKDVRADILSALERQSSQEMCIALKLPPLSWAEKLQSIFAEIKDSQADAISACLLPPQRASENEDSCDPLEHEDWRVRANAAGILAYLNIRQAIPRMVRALDDSAESRSAAFCHLSYSLGKLGTDEARRALSRHLSSKEAWFAVDAAGALSAWSLAESGADLAGALTSRQTLPDYMSLAVAGCHSPLSFLDQDNMLLQDAGFELVLGLLQATSVAASADAIVKAKLPDCLPRLLDLLLAAPSPRRARTMLAFCLWLEENGQISFTPPASFDLPAARQTAAAGRDFIATTVDLSFLKSWLENAGLQGGESAGQVAHAIKLCGQLCVADSAPYLIPLLSPDSPFVNEAVESLGDLKFADCAPLLVELIHSCQDLNERTQAKLSKHPVFEESPGKALTYWTALGALAKLPHKDGAACLLKAACDFAPDKRGQALSALIENCLDPSIARLFLKQTREIIRQRLGDPSLPVKQTALSAVARLGLSELIPQVIRLSASKEPSLYRQALRTLSDLSSAGNQQKVTAALKARLSVEFHPEARRRLHDLLSGL